MRTLNTEELAQVYGGHGKHNHGKHKGHHKVKMKKDTTTRRNKKNTTTRRGHYKA
jgi:bacteriocin-like protein